MRFCVLLIFILSLNAVQAQKRINARVVDAVTEEPLAYAHVGIFDTSVGTITNSDGYFSLLIPDEQNGNFLGVSYLGYSLIRLPLNKVPGIIAAKKSNVELKELVITAKNRSLIEEAIELIPRNHDQGNMRLRAFWRARMKRKNNHLQLTESAFDIFRKDGVDAMKILKSRSVRDTTAFEDFNQFNAGVSPKGLFATSFLVDQNILSRKTRKRHVYELTDVTTFNERPVFVIEFDKKEGYNKNGYSGTILLDTETLAFVRLAFGFSKRNEEKSEVYENWLYKKITGLGNSVWEKADMEINFQSIDDHWYFSHATYDVKWTLIDNDETFQIPIDYRADFVATEIDRSNDRLPSKDERAGKNILARQSDSNTTDFWKDYTFLLPDDNLEDVFTRIDKKNSLRK